MRPHHYRPDTHRVLVVDLASGECVTSDGRAAGTYQTVGGKIPTRAILTAARELGCRRVFLTGPKPVTTGWMDEPAGDGWRHAGHFYKLRDPCGRWTWEGGGTVEVRRAAAWFGEGDYTPAQAVEAFRVLHLLLTRKTSGSVGLLASPAATGQSLWAYGLREGQVEAFSDPDVAALIRSTSPQHREEVVGRCFDGCDEHVTPPKQKAKELVYVDGVFMYAACVRELGTGPAVLDVEHLDAAGRAEQAWKDNPYRRARYEVVFTVPKTWEGPGLLAVKHPNGRNWHYPSAPGYRGRTWVDGCELHLAEKAGWSFQMLGMIAFVEGTRPVDTFADRIVALRGVCDRERSAPVTAALVSRGLRSMFIRTVGAWHSIGRERTYVAQTGERLPDHVTEWETRKDGSRVYTVTKPLTGNAAAFARPELSSQVWARARAKVTAAMLTLPPTDVVAVWGDALYLAADPGWAGVKPGEFRVKGQLVGPVSRPKTIGELLKLRATMEEATS